MEWLEATAKIPPQQMLGDLGIEYTEKINRLAMQCPFHDDRNPSSAFYTDTKLFHCFSCQLTLTMVGFYGKYKELTKAQAEAELIKAYGGVPEREEVDRYASSMARLLAEDKLRGRRGSDQRMHAAVGEALDFVMWAFDRGHLTNDQLNRALIFWYSLVDACLLPAVEQDRDTRDSVDDRVKEGIGGVSGGGPENSRRSVDQLRAEVSDRLCAIAGKVLPPRKISGEGVDPRSGRPLRGECGHDEVGVVELT